MTLQEALSILTETGQEVLNQGSLPNYLPDELKQAIKITNIFQVLFADYGQLETISLKRLHERIDEIQRII
jgi:hypothetical protein